MTMQDYFYKVACRVVCALSGWHEEKRKENFLREEIRSLRVVYGRYVKSSAVPYKGDLMLELRLQRVLHGLEWARRC